MNASSGVASVTREVKRILKMSEGCVENFYCEVPGLSNQEPRGDRHPDQRGASDDAELLQLRPSLVAGLGRRSQSRHGPRYRFRRLTGVGSGPGSSTARRRKRR